MQATYIGLYKTSWLVSSVHHSCRVSVSLSFWKAKSHQLIAMGKRYRRASADCTRANRLFHRFRLCFTEFSSDCANLAIETVLIYWLASMQRRGECWGWCIQSQQKLVGFDLEMGRIDNLKSTLVRLTLQSVLSFPLVCAHQRLISRRCEHYCNGGLWYTVCYSIRYVLINQLIEPCVSKSMGWNLKHLLHKVRQRKRYFEAPFETQATNGQVPPVYRMMAAIQPSSFLEKAFKTCGNSCFDILLIEPVNFFLLLSDNWEGIKGSES